MRLSTKGRYAVRSMVDLALHGNGGPVTREQIASRQEISADYLARLFTRLVKARFFYRPFRKKRTLIGPVPARATHGELEFLSPLIDWNSMSARTAGMPEDR